MDKSERGEHTPCLAGLSKNPFDRWDTLLVGTADLDMVVWLAQFLRNWSALPEHVRHELSTRAPSETPDRVPNTYGSQRPDNGFGLVHGTCIGPPLMGRANRTLWP